MAKITVTLLTGRTIDQGTTKEHSKLSKEYCDNVAICEIDPNDMKKLNIRENSNIKIATEHGSVVVKAKLSKRTPHPKTVYMPYGLWANILINSKTHGTGMPSFKGVTAEIQPALTENVATVPQLLKQAFRKDPQCQ